jgi:hypothetical protein
MLFRFIQLLDVFFNACTNSLRPDYVGSSKSAKGSGARGRKALADVSDESDADDDDSAQGKPKR